MTEPLLPELEAERDRRMRSSARLGTSGAGQ